MTSKKAEIVRNHPLIQLQAERIRMAMGSARLSIGELADKVSAELGYSLDRNAVSKIANGLRDAGPIELEAIANVTGQPIGMIRGDEYVLRGLDGAKGLWLNPDGHNKWADWAFILKSDRPERDPYEYGVDHSGRIVHRSWLHQDTLPFHELEDQVA